MGVRGAATESTGASLGHEPGLGICPGMCLRGAGTSPGPRCPPRVPPAPLSTSSAASGVSPISAHEARPPLSKSVNPIEGGGHGLWGPLSPPGPPELRPQEQSPPKQVIAPQGAVPVGVGGGGCSGLLPSTGIWGDQPHPPDPFALEHGGAAHISGGAWGSTSRFRHSSDVFGTEVFITRLAQPGSGGVHQLGPCPETWNFGSPKAHPGAQRSPLGPPIPHPPSQLWISQPCPIPPPQLAWIWPDPPHPTHPRLYKP